MWRRRYFNWICGVASCFLLQACADSPEDVVSSYLEHTFLDNNGIKAYDLLSSEDKLYTDRNEFVKNLKRENVLNKKILEKYESHFSYEIIDTQINEDTSFVTVAISKPNAINVLGELVGYAMYSAFATLPENQQALAIARKFDAIMMSKDRLQVTEEKVFRLIKEKDEYRLFLDLGRPYKQQLLHKEAENLRKKAELKEQNGDFEAALQMYNESLALKHDQVVLSRAILIKRRLEHTLYPGQQKDFGMLRFRPETIEIRKVRIRRNPQGLPAYTEYTANEYMVMTYQVQNISEGQVFAIEEDNIFRTKSRLTDNYGNIMRELRPDIYTDEIEGMEFRLLKPGEKAVFKVVCEVPLNNKAGKFTWKILLKTDNEGAQTEAFVDFCSDQIQNISRMVKA